MIDSGFRRLALGGICLALAACSSSRGLTKGDEELGLDPQGSPAELYVRMAEAYYGRGQLEEAFRRANKAVEADDSYPRAHIWLAFLYEQIKQTDRARPHYQRALELGPNNPDVHYAYGSFLCRQRQYAEADAEFAKTLANPLYATPWLAMTSAGNCAASAGNSSKAEGYYRSAISAQPGFGPPLVELAKSSSKRGDAKTAQEYIDRYFGPGTVRTPETSYSALTIGIEIERKLGNRKRADEYERLLRTNFAQAPRTTDL